MSIICYRGHEMRIVGTKPGRNILTIYYYCNGITCTQKKEVKKYRRSGEIISEREIDNFPSCVEQRAIDFL